MKFLLMLFISILSSAAVAEAESKPPTNLIQDVISNQITAFLNKDAQAAWRYAHPSIKAQFATAERFMAMVAAGYSPLLNFSELKFEELTQANGQWLQKLSLRDASGNWYELYYTLVEVQPEQVQITGVVLEPIDSI